MHTEVLKIIQTTVHYSLHLLVPGLVAYIWYKDNWKKAWFIFLATMVVDLDHLAATPVFDPNRCSINFHFLHTYQAITVYAVIFLFVKNRTAQLIALGLLMHMVTDYQDCLWLNYIVR